MRIERIKSSVEDNVLISTGFLSIIAYLLVITTFEGYLPYPDISRYTVDVLSHLIALVNSAAAVLLVIGWMYIRRGNIQRHRQCMTSAFILIIAFLLMYLPKVGGGGEKHLVGAPPSLHTAYLVMLAVHIILSALAMPLVIYVFLIGWSHDTVMIPETNHPRIGRVAAAAWIISLILGVVTYVILNHIYTYSFHPIGSI